MTMMIIVMIVMVMMRVGMDEPVVVMSVAMAFEDDERRPCQHQQNARQERP